MYQRLVVISTAALLTLSGALAQSALSNADIVQQVKSGASDDSILNAIDQQGSQFSNDASSLIEMKNAGVRERILIAMIRKGPPPDEALNSDSVIRLARAGFSDDFLAVVLQAQPGRFGSGPESIGALHRAGISDRIISLMIPGALTIPGAAPPPPVPSAGVSEASAPRDRNPEPARSDRPPGREIPSGTRVSVRVIDSIDSERNREGDKFRASLDEPVRIGDDILIPRGADARIRLIADQSAGKFTGRAELTLRLEDITVDGKPVTVNTSAVTESSKSQGASTAKKAAAVGAVGAIIGALAGGGKGAAIGAGAGATAGAGSGVFMKGPRVKVPSETVLTFTTEGSIRLP